MRPAISLKNTPNWGLGIPGLTGEEWCITLTQGFVALIDKSADCWLSKHAWSTNRDSAGNFRAIRKIGPRGRQKTVAMRVEIARHVLARLGVSPIRVKTRSLGDRRLLVHRIIDNRPQALDFHPTGHPGISCCVRRSGGRPTIRWRAHVDYGGQRLVPGCYHSEFEARLAQRRYILSHYTAAAPRLIRKYGLQSPNPPQFPENSRINTLSLDTLVIAEVGFVPMSRKIESDLLNRIVP